MFALPFCWCFSCGIVFTHHLNHLLNYFTEIQLWIKIYFKALPKKVCRFYLPFNVEQAWFLTGPIFSTKNTIGDEGSSALLTVYTAYTANTAFTAFTAFTAVCFRCFHRSRCVRFLHCWNSSGAKRLLCLLHMIWQNMWVQWVEWARYPLDCYDC